MGHVDLSSVWYGVFAKSLRINALIARRYAACSRPALPLESTMFLSHAASAGSDTFPPALLRVDHRKHQTPIIPWLLPSNTASGRIRTAREPCTWEKDALNDNNYENRGKQCQESGQESTSPSPRRTCAGTSRRRAPRGERAAPRSRSGRSTCIAPQHSSAQASRSRNTFWFQRSLAGSDVAMQHRQTLTPSPHARESIGDARETAAETRAE